MLDVCFQEDKMRSVCKRGAENFSRMNSMALAVIRNVPAPSLRSKSLKSRRFRADADEDYLMKSLTDIENVSALHGEERALKVHFQALLFLMNQCGNASETGEQSLYLPSGGRRGKIRA